MVVLVVVVLVVVVVVVVASMTEIAVSVWANLLLTESVQGAHTVGAAASWAAKAWEQEEVVEAEKGTSVSKYTLRTVRRNALLWRRLTVGYGLQRIRRLCRRCSCGA